jgi:hypothetical protein
MAAVRERAETGVVVPSQRSSTKMVGRERPLFLSCASTSKKQSAENGSASSSHVWRKCAKASVARPDWAAFVVFGT